MARSTRVTEELLDDGSVVSRTIAEQAVTETKIDNYAVTTNKLGTGAVTNTKIADSGVTASKLGTGAVTETKVADGAVTASKLGTGAVTEDKLGSGAVTTNKLGAEAVTEDKLGSEAVTTNKLGAEAVTEDKLGSGAVTTSKLGTGAVTNSKIANGTIASSKMQVPPVSQGLHTIWIPARAMHPSVTSGASFTQLHQSSSSKPSIPAVTFSYSVVQYVEFAIAWPKSWNAGALYVQFVWSRPSGSGSGVVWGIRSKTIYNGDSYDSNFGSTVTSANTGNIAKNMYISGRVTVPISGADDQYVGYFQLLRDVTSPSDTLVADAYLHGVRIMYGVDTENDN